MAQTGDVPGMVAGIGQMLRHGKTVWRMIRTGSLAHKLGPVSVLGRFAGGLAVVTGAIQPLTTVHHPTVLPENKATHSRYTPPPAPWDRRDAAPTAGPGAG